MTHIYTPDEQRVWQNQLPKKNMSALVLVQCNQDILMLKPSYKNHFVFPGGVADQNESPRQTAIRELSEETGISVTEDDLSFTGVSYMPSHNDFPEKIVFSFLYNCHERPSLHLQADEIESAEWIPIDNILEKSGKKRALYVNIREKLATNNMPFYSDLSVIP